MLSDMESILVGRQRQDIDYMLDIGTMSKDIHYLFWIFRLNVTQIKLNNFYFLYSMRGIIIRG